MHRGWYLILFICAAMIALFIFDLMFMNGMNSTHKVENGVIDLRSERLTDNRVVSLNGEWRFEHPSVDHTPYIRVPGNWRLQDAPLSSIGSGTYRLDIWLNKDQVGDTMGLYIPNVATAYEVWIDGQYKVGNGTIGEEADVVTPVNYARTVYFVPESERVELSIHVSNFSQRKGGLWDALHLGTADAIALKSEKKIALQLLVVGALLMMSIYLMIIYFLRNSQISAFYLGLLTLLIAVRTLLVGETFFIRIFPHFPWELQVKLEYITLILGVPLTIRYIHHLYPKESWPKVRLGVDIISFLYLSVIIMTPALLYTQFLVIYQIIMLPVVAYMIYLFIRAMIRRRPTSYFNFACLVIFLVAVLNDALFYLNFINTGQFASKGFFMFLVSQTLVHALKYAYAYSNIEKLSAELNRVNLSLEHKVEERTRELKLANTRLQHVEHSRKALISDISHELSGPMTLIQGYVEAIMDHKIPSEEKYWQVIHDKTHILKRLVQDLSALSELELRKIKMEFQEVQATHFIQQIYDQFQGEIAANGYSLRWSNREEWAATLPAGCYVVIDRDRMYQVLFNVINNAVKYAREVKEIAMEVMWESFQNEGGGQYGGERIGNLILKIIDRGQGIDEHELPHIFKRLYRGTKAKEVNHDSRGLGLAISKEIMDIHSGEIWAESKVGQGSKFSISLPIYIIKERTTS